MKYIIVLGDGMADEPIKQLDGKTPIKYAQTETLDMLSKTSEIGMVHTIPEGMSPGSEVLFRSFSAGSIVYWCRDERYGCGNPL